jgi:hypothetical protein
VLCSSTKGCSCMVSNTLQSSIFANSHTCTNTSAHDFPMYYKACIVCHYNVKPWWWWSNFPIVLFLLSLLPFPFASQPSFWTPPLSMMKKKMWPNFLMFSHNKEGWNCDVVEFQLLLLHKWSEAMGLDDLMAKKNLQVANILPANWQSCCCCYYYYRSVGDGLGSWRQI